MAERKAEIDRWIGKMSRRGEDKRKERGREGNILLLDVPNDQKNTTTCQCLSSGTYSLTVAYVQYINKTNLDF